ncbi:MAG: enoyl-CoA hydratase/isomerase family protein, partial [Solirubrobacterales bacterium]|nr:enoyl-CoA hydratase/isomerase family protein [Solirubrobacterales bacterium]
MTNTIKFDNRDGVVVLTLDDPNQSANTMNADFTPSLKAAVEQLEGLGDALKGVVITSAKKTFFAGGDLHMLKQVRPENAAELSAVVEESKALLRRLETLGKPVVAAINGAALGGGYEIALASHHRILVDDSSAIVGLPEVSLGLLPGAGGVVRTVRKFGIVSALMNVLTKSLATPGFMGYKPDKALELGLVDEVVPSADALLPAAEKWISENPAAQQPWDADKKYKIPGG